MDARQLRCPVVPVRLHPGRRLGGARVVATPWRRARGRRSRPRATRAGRHLSSNRKAIMTRILRLMTSATLALAATLLVSLVPGPAHAASEALAKLCDEYWQG